MSEHKPNYLNCRHVWRLYGGIKENPGVFGSFDDVTIQHKCSKCGAVRQENEGTSFHSYEDACTEWLTPDTKDVYRRRKGRLPIPPHKSKKQRMASNEPAEPVNV